MFAPSRHCLTIWLNLSSTQLWLNKLCPLRETIYLHRTVPYPEIFNKDSYFAVIVGIKQMGNLLENFAKLSEKKSGIFAHWRIMV